MDTAETTAASSLARHHRGNSRLAVIARLAYWVAVGWWASWIWVQIAWFLNASLVLREESLWMLNRIPYVLFLQKPWQPATRPLINARAARDQHPRILRVGYFLCVGWWASWLLANLGWTMSVTILGLPLGMLLLSYLAPITTLRRED